MIQEPKWMPSSSQKENQKQLSAAFEWYRSKMKIDDNRESLKKYMCGLYTPEECALAKSSDVREIGEMYGWMADAILNGANLPADTLARMNAEIRLGIEKTRLRLKKEKHKDRPKPKQTIKDFINNKVSSILGELDEIQDQLTENFSMKFDPQQFFSGKGLRAVHFQRIKRWHVRIFSELQEALSGSDDQIKEAYSAYSKKDLKKWLAHEKGIVEACTKMSVTLSPKKKVQKSKAPKAEKK